MANSMREELWQLSASQVLPRLRNGDVSAVEYITSLVQRVEQRDKAVKAWVGFDSKVALEQAKQLDALPDTESGPLHGLPIGVKDVILTKDMPTQYNSPLFESHTPIGTDANAIASLRSAGKYSQSAWVLNVTDRLISGAIIFGKTATTEFATSKQGNIHQNLTANPHDPRRTPGGSSSGSGAAVGDYQIPVALGTQTGGSIIRPASFNGCYGLKPTFGAISREGAARWSESFDTLGFFTRSVEDLDVLLDVFHIQDNLQPPKEPFNLDKARIGFYNSSYWPNAGPGTRQAMDKAREILRSHGAIVEDIDVPREFDQILAWHAVLLAKEGQTSFLGQYLTDRTKINEQRIAGFVEQGHETSREAQLQASDNLARLRPIFDEIASRYAIVITPSVVDEAPGIENTGDMNFCSMWTALHGPALNIPGFVGENGLPIGLTAVGPRFSDRHLLHVSKALGAAFAEGGWSNKPHQ